MKIFQNFIQAKACTVLKSSLSRKKLSGNQFADYKSKSKKKYDLDIVIVCVNQREKYIYDMRRKKITTVNYVSIK